MAKQELGPNQLKWIEALESGKYEQGVGALCESGTYCCLGVGCDVFAIPSTTPMPYRGRLGFGESRETAEAPSELCEILGLKGRCGGLRGPCLKDEASLTEANDHGATFTEIAAYCREHPESVFAEPR